MDYKQWKQILANLCRTMFDSSQNQQDILMIRLKNIDQKQKRPDDGSTGKALQDSGSGRHGWAVWYLDTTCDHHYQSLNLFFNIFLFLFHELFNVRVLGGNIQ